MTSLIQDHDFNSLKQYYYNFVHNSVFKNFKTFKQCWKNLNYALIDYREMTDKNCDKYYEIRDMINQINLIWNIMNFHSFQTPRYYRRIDIFDALPFVMDNYKVSNHFINLSDADMTDIFWMYSTIRDREE